MSDQGIFNPNEGKAPAFPSFNGAERIPEDERGRIADAAWSQSNGNMTAFEQLCGEHMRGEINLFGDAPQAIGGPGARAVSPTRAEVEQAAAAGGAPTREPGIVPGVDAPAAEAGAEHGTAAGPAADAAEADRRAADAAAAGAGEGETGSGAAPSGSAARQIADDAAREAAERDAARDAERTAAAGEADTAAARRARREGGEAG